ncbi:MAG TPA: hypothetical protein VK190_10170 [Pseudoneobacillus sp.]|nr:hypothetical protein [Pseudoneobacillus sp.]
MDENELVSKIKRMYIELSEVVDKLTDEDERTITFGLKNYYTEESLDALQILRNYANKIEGILKEDIKKKSR